MANYFDTGILLTAGFSLSSQAPLDGRSVVELLTDLDTHIAENRAYEGMCVYVKEDKKIYIFNGTTWEEFVGGGSSEKQIKDWVSGDSYLEGDYIYHEGEIYRCLTSNSDVDFDETNWEQVTYGIDELSKEDVERLLGLTEEEIEAMEGLILDTEVRIDKTYSSSKIYTDIQQCLEDSKTYTLEEIAKIGTASYKIVTDVVDMTEERYLYLLHDGATNYDIYVVEADGTPTKIGSTQIDLSNYYTKEEVDELLEANAVDLSGYTKTYTSLNALGLTTDATVEDVVNALKNGESFLAPVNTFTNYETIFPNKVPNDQWNKIHIIKGTSLASSHIRCFSPSGTFEYLANINNTNIVAWNDVSGTYIDISDAVIEKLGNEILKYPVGKYRINSTTTGNKFTDLPSDAEMKCGLIEINGTAVGKSPFTDTWVYRMYKFECLTGTLSYVRRLNSGATAGQIELDTGWCKDGQDIYTSLSSLGLTAPVSVGEIFNAMPDKTMAVLTCEAKDDTEGTVNISDIPASFGVLTIKKNDTGRFSIDYQNSLQSSPCNVKRWIGTLKGIDGSGLYWKQLSAEPTFIALTDIGLTADATFQDVIDALPKGGSAILGVTEFTNYQTIFPYEEGNDQFARVHIIKGTADGSRVYARWFRKDGVKEAIAIFNINDNKFNGWKRIIIEGSKSDPYTCTSYTALTGTEDLFTLPCGHYVSATINTAYNYPVTDSSNATAHIYVLGCLNEPTNNKGYRIILYFDNKGRMYNINEWWGGFGTWNRLNNDDRITQLEAQVNQLLQSIN